MPTLGTRVRLTKGAMVFNSSTSGMNDEGHGRYSKGSFGDQRRMGNTAAISVRVDREII